MRQMPLSNPSVLISIMRQPGATTSPTKLDELADSLTARVLSSRGRESDSVRYFGASVALLTLAEVGNTGDTRGDPYSGTLARLIRIHRESTVESLRDRALDFMITTTGRQTALTYLTKVAVSDDPTAPRAVRALVVDARGGDIFRTTTPAERQESLAILQELNANHSVHDATTARDLALALQALKAKP